MKIHGIANLMDVFGDSRATWKARLESGMPVFERQPEHSGKPHVFDSQDVHGWLVAQATGRPAGSLDPQQERARLDEARRRLCELQIALQEKTLIPGEVVTRVWSAVTSTARQRFLAMPGSLLPQLLAANGNAAQIVEVVTGAVYQALTEVSEIPIEDYV